MSKPTLVSTRDTPNSTDQTSRAAKKPIAAKNKELLRENNSKDPEMT
jgi:hypothetical protein